MYDNENGVVYDLLDNTEDLTEHSLEDRLLLEAIACTGWDLRAKLKFLSDHGNRDLVYQTAGFHRKLDAELPNNSIRLRRRQR